MCVAASPSASLRPSTSDTFVELLDIIDTVYPAGRGHIITDNLSAHDTPDVNDWFDEHPRWKRHFTPKHASWLNQIECWFSILGRHALARGSFPSPDDLASKIDAYVQWFLTTDQPFHWSYRPKSWRMDGQTSGGRHRDRIEAAVLHRAEHDAAGPTVDDELDANLSELVFDQLHQVETLLTIALRIEEWTCTMVSMSSASRTASKGLEPHLLGSKKPLRRRSEHSRRGATVFLIAPERAQEEVRRQTAQGARAIGGGARKSRRTSEELGWDAIRRKVDRYSPGYDG